MSLKDEFFFIKTLYNERKEKIQNLFETNCDLKKWKKILFPYIKNELLKIIRNNKEPFQFFTEKEKNSFKDYSKEFIWNWCLINSSLQYQFIDTVDNQGYRLRSYDSQRLKEAFVFCKEMVQNKLMAIDYLKKQDIPMKKERIHTIHCLFEFFSIKNQVFTEDPLFKKGFLATMLYNELTGSDIQEGPCIDYHLINLYRIFDKEEQNLFNIRLKMFYTILNIHEENGIDYKKIDNALFAYARKQKHCTFISERTTYF